MAVRAFAQMAERETGMSKKRPAIIFFSIFAILGLVLGITSCNSLMDKPLGPSLKGNPTAQPNSKPLSTPVTPATTVPSPTQVQATQLPPLCGNVPVLTI